MSERSFARAYGDRYQAPLVFGALVETYTACLCGNENAAETPNMLKLRNK